MFLNTIKQETVFDKFWFQLTKDVLRYLNLLSE